ncbi:hypothetical protein CDD83_4187 [Cordyceps sp. RAO-2017]|nr:hypothetical protein CDD83_4187 [Cordyceps sp. RAO-2017]
MPASPLVPCHLEISHIAAYPSFWPLRRRPAGPREPWPGKAPHIPRSRLGCGLGKGDSISPRERQQYGNGSGAPVVARWSSQGEPGLGRASTPHARIDSLAPGCPSAAGRGPEPRLYIVAVRTWPADPVFILARCKAPHAIHRRAAAVPRLRMPSDVLGACLVDLPSPPLGTQILRPRRRRRREMRAGRPPAMAQAREAPTMASRRPRDAAKEEKNGADCGAGEQTGNRRRAGGHQMKLQAGPEPAVRRSSAGRWLAGTPDMMTNAILHDGQDGSLYWARRPCQISSADGRGPAPESQPPCVHGRMDPLISWPWLRQTPGPVRSPSTGLGFSSGGLCNGQCPWAIAHLPCDEGVCSTDPDR